MRCVWKWSENQNLSVSTETTSLPKFIVFSFSPRSLSSSYLCYLTVTYSLYYHLPVGIVLFLSTCQGNEP